MYGNKCKYKYEGTYKNECKPYTSQKTKRSEKLLQSDKSLLQQTYVKPHAVYECLDTDGTQSCKVSNCNTGGTQTRCVEGTQTETYTQIMGTHQTTSTSKLKVVNVGNVYHVSATCRSSSARKRGTGKSPVETDERLRKLQRCHYPYHSWSVIKHDCRSLSTPPDRPVTRRNPTDMPNPLGSPTRSRSGEPERSLNREASSRSEECGKSSKLYNSVHASSSRLRPVPAPRKNVKGTEAALKKRQGRKKSRGSIKDVDKVQSKRTDKDTPPTCSNVEPLPVAIQARGDEISDRGPQGYESDVDDRVNDSYMTGKYEKDVEDETYSSTYTEEKPRDEDTENDSAPTSYDDQKKGSNKLLRQELPVLPECLRSSSKKLSDQDYEKPPKCNSSACQPTCLDLRRVKKPANSNGKGKRSSQVADEGDVRHRRNSNRSEISDDSAGEYNRNIRSESWEKDCEECTESRSNCEDVEETDESGARNIYCRRKKASVSSGVEDSVGSRRSSSEKKYCERSRDSFTTSVIEHEYLQFSLRITEDIIRNDLYTNCEMKRVFNSHIEANRGRLDMEKMKKQIKNLSAELNIPYDDANMCTPSCREDVNKAQENLKNILSISDHLSGANRNCACGSVRCLPSNCYLPPMKSPRPSQEPELMSKTCNGTDDLSEQVIATVALNKTPEANSIGSKSPRLSVDSQASESIESKTDSNGKPKRRRTKSSSKTGRISMKDACFDDKALNSESVTEETKLLQCGTDCSAPLTQKIDSSNKRVSRAITQDGQVVSSAGAVIAEASLFEYFRQRSSAAEQPSGITECSQMYKDGGNEKSYDNRPSDIPLTINQAIITDVEHVKSNRICQTATIEVARNYAHTISVSTQSRRLKSGKASSKKAKQKLESAPPKPHAEGTFDKIVQAPEIILVLPCPVCQQTQTPITMSNDSSVITDEPKFDSTAQTQETFDALTSTFYRGTQTLSNCSCQTASYEGSVGTGVEKYLATTVVQTLCSACQETQTPELPVRVGAIHSQQSSVPQARNDGTLTDPIDTKDEITCTCAKETLKNEEQTDVVMDEVVDETYNFEMLVKTSNVTGSVPNVVKCEHDVESYAQNVNEVMLDTNAILQESLMYANFCKLFPFGKADVPPKKDDKDYVIISGPIYIPTHAVENMPSCPCVEKPVLEYSKGLEARLQCNEQNQDQNLLLLYSDYTQGPSKNSELPTYQTYPTMKQQPPEKLHMLPPNLNVNCKTCQTEVASVQKCTQENCKHVTNDPLTADKNNLLLTNDYNSGLPPNILTYEYQNGIMPSTISKYFPTISTQTYSSDFLMLDAKTNDTSEMKQRGSLNALNRKTTASEFSSVPNFVQYPTTQQNPDVSDAIEKKGVGFTSNERVFSETEEGGIEVQERPILAKENSLEEQLIAETELAGEESSDKLGKVEEVDVVVEEDLIQTEQDNKESVEQEKLSIIKFDVPKEVSVTKVESVQKEDSAAPLVVESSLFKFASGEDVALSSQVKEEDDESETSYSDADGSSGMLLVEEEPKHDISDTHREEESRIIMMSGDDDSVIDNDSGSNDIEDIVQKYDSDKLLNLHSNTQKEESSSNIISTINDDVIKKLDYKPDHVSMSDSMANSIKQVNRESHQFRHPEDRRISWGSGRLLIQKLRKSLEDNNDIEVIKEEDEEESTSTAQESIGKNSGGLLPTLK